MLLLELLPSGKKPREAFFWKNNSIRKSLKDLGIHNAQALLSKAY